MKYQAFVDIPLDDQWENIDVIDLVVEGDNPEQAHKNAVKEISEQYVDFYVWEITEDDKLNDEDL